MAAVSLSGRQNMAVVFYEKQLKVMKTISMKNLQEDAGRLLVFPFCGILSRWRHSVKLSGIME
jgi:hypothetical protein